MYHACNNFFGFGLKIILYLRQLLKVYTVQFLTQCTVYSKVLFFMIFLYTICTQPNEYTLYILIFLCIYKFTVVHLVMYIVHVNCDNSYWCFHEQNYIVHVQYVCLGISDDGDDVRAFTIARVPSSVSNPDCSVGWFLNG